MSAITGTHESLHFLRPRLTRQWDRRSARIAFLIAIVAALNAVDLIYTLCANNVAQITHSGDMFREMNPLAATFMQLGLLPSLICFKILMVFCGLGLLWKVRRSRWVLPACWVLVIAYAGLAAMWCFWVSDVNSMLEMRLASPVP